MNVNKVFLAGNLTRDPELSYTPNQTAVCSFGLAVNRRWKGSDGQQRDETCFVDCTAFGNLGTNINKYCGRGKPLFVEGRLNFESWTAKDGTKRSKHKVIVESFQFLPDGQKTTDSGEDNRSLGDINEDSAPVNQWSGDIPF